MVYTVNIDRSAFDSIVYSNDVTYPAQKCHGLMFMKNPLKFLPEWSCLFVVSDYLRLFENVIDPFVPERCKIKIRCIQVCAPQVIDL